MKNIILILAGLILLGAITATIYWYYQYKIAPDSAPPLPQINLPLLNNNSEPQSAHPTEAGETPVSPAVKPAGTETLSPSLAIDEEVQESLAETHQKPTEQVNVVTNLYSDSHAKGIVSYKEGPDGGWWLAYKDKGGWQVVDEGSGIVPCQTAEEYDFPREIVSRCFDQKVNKVISR